MSVSYPSGPAQVGSLLLTTWFGFCAGLVGCALALCLSVGIGAGLSVLDTPRAARVYQLPAAEVRATSILGAAEVDASTLARGVIASGHPDVADHTGIAADELAALYLQEGDKAGVRGDWAFAQAVLETGWFTNRGVGYHNYAGIAHCDTCASGTQFADPAAGVRAHVQLLAKVAGTDLGDADTAPEWFGDTVTGFDELGGANRWATDEGYWPKLANVYRQLGGTVDDAP